MQAVSAGYEHSCALKTDSTIICWGEQSKPLLCSFGFFDASSRVICLLWLYVLSCAGDNSYGQINVPPALKGVRQVATGYVHTCVLKTDGTVFCWGRYTAFSLYSLPQVCYAILQSTIHAGCERGTAWLDGSVVIANAVLLSICHHHTLAGGGNGHGYGQSIPPPGLKGVVQISTGWLHSCALKADGIVVCWGKRAAQQGSRATQNCVGCGGCVGAFIVHTCTATL